MYILSVCLCLSLSVCLSVCLSTWAKCLDELNIPHQVEPRNRYTDSENRPDITTYDPTGHLRKTWTFHLLVHIFVTSYNKLPKYQVMQLS